VRRVRETFTLMARQISAPESTAMILFPSEEDALLSWFLEFAYLLAHDLPSYTFHDQSCLYIKLLFCSLRGHTISDFTVKGPP
jgi:hypothetical protein